MRRAGFVTVVGSLILALAGALYGQELATLKATISDQTGAVIPGATVTVTNRQTGAKRTDITESHGLSVIPGLPPGNYELTVDAKGFASQKMAIVLSVGQIGSLNVTMGVTVKEEFQVQATVQGIDTEKSEGQPGH